MRNNYVRDKSLYCATFDGVMIQIRLQFNTNTEHMGINTRFRKSSRNGGSKTNRTCSMFLGVTVAERVLSKVFDNVIRMPNGNPGYDFECNKGYKIDVKSSTIRKNGNYWSFIIKHNIIADYFLCIAFDNLVNLNPLHIWLIPGQRINHILSSTTISSSTLDKWAEYELTDKLDVVIGCCNTIKNI